ncbi:hypothetical protein NA57DRAFT_53199 [Rhizodiscina lignyota]|uniref:Uncharacterized protein n=1 Tax=Rhizodiscina lignyota TaxID=1504668 RepID=A0A9P4IJN9_9PEZI|nr:hypothetical protein NA57DRAFT_53199 [Rhizodiscina lignyota]
MTTSNGEVEAIIVLHEACLMSASHVHNEDLDLHALISVYCGDNDPIDIPSSLPNFQCFAQLSNNARVDIALCDISVEDANLVRGNDAHILVLKKLEKDLTDGMCIANAEHGHVGTAPLLSTATDINPPAHRALSQFALEVIEHDFHFWAVSDVWMGVEAASVHDVREWRS